MRTVTLLVTTVLVSLHLFTPAIAEESETLDNAVRWLVAQQDQSGAFKSRHYGAMKQGAALTSLVLYALSSTDEDRRTTNQDAIDGAFDFLLPGTTARGRVANPDGSLDHPVYSTAMFLVAAKRLNRKLDPKLVQQLLKFLVDSQCVEDRGFQPANPNFGGWDVIGPDVMPGKTAGTNVSVTSFVLEAFASYVPLQDTPDPEVIDATTAEMVTKSRVKALSWIQRLQESSDGGFHFTAQPGSALNKSKSESGMPRSYSSASCDGMLAMVYCGMEESEGATKVSAWIRRESNVSKVSGFPEPDTSGWSDALHFYHLQCLMRASKVTDDDEWSQRIARAAAALLAKAQKEDGRFENESALMRENDPLIATSFAIIALSNR